MNDPTYDHIWCPSCEAIRELVRDPMPANELNDRGAMDMQCKVCHLVIATLYDATAST